MNINRFSKTKNNPFYLQVQPSEYYDTESLIDRMINQGSELTKQQIRLCFNDLMKTVKFILIEGGRININDFLSLYPTIAVNLDSQRYNNIDRSTIPVSVKASVPLVFSESIDMETRMMNILK